MAHVLPATQADGLTDLTLLRELTGEAHRWLRQQAWPRWLEHGIDRNAGGFHEHLSLDQCACAADYRRLRVVTRQIIAFSAAAAAAVLGAAEAVRMGCQFLRSRAKLPEGGYAWRFNLLGLPVNFTRDLYDHAFVLLAWSNAAPWLPPGEALAEALEVDHFLQTQLRHPAGGYAESLPGSEPRRQNPHMHLLEAYLHAAEHLGDPRFCDRAEELVELFLGRLFQPREGALPEFFDDDLAPLRAGGRFMAEPGHHAEWIWLLTWYRGLAARFDLTVPDLLDDVINALTKFLRQEACYTPNGALVDEVWSNGSLRQGTARLWPQTERLKSAVLSPDAKPLELITALAVVKTFIAGAPSGLWHERWTPDHGFLAVPAAASSLYHLTGGILLADRAMAPNVGSTAWILKVSF